MRRALAILSFPYTFAGALVTMIDALPRIDEPAVKPPEPPGPQGRAGRWWRRALVLLCVIGVALAGAEAWAYWTAGAPGASAEGVAASVDQVTGLARPGASPTANPDVTLQWSAALLSSGHAVDGYLVVRYDGSTATPVCGSSPTPLPALTCTDSSVPDGTYSYGVSARLGSWTGPESARISVTVDTTAPTFVTEPSDPSAYAGPTFAFSHSDYSSFVCQLDGAGGFTAAHCAPVPPTDDSHTLAVKAQAADGSLTAAAVYTWTVRAKAPAITTKPSDPSTDTAPAFAFALAGYSSFVCQLDGSGTFTPQQCSPDGLGDGSHTLAVKAQAVDGSATAAASYTWTVGAAAPTSTTTISDSTTGASTTTTTTTTTTSTTTGATDTSGPSVEPAPDPAPPGSTDSVPAATVTTGTTTDTSTDTTTETGTDSSVPPPGG